MQKIIIYKDHDLLFDPSAVADSINAACQRGERYFLRGTGQLDDRVYFFLQPCTSATLAEKVVLAPLDDLTTDAVGGELTERWANGFNTIGILELPGRTVIGVFARIRDKA